VSSMRTTEGSSESEDYGIDMDRGHWDEERF
jgi:hypothetical protein